MNTIARRLTRLSMIVAVIAAAISTQTAQAADRQVRIVQLQPVVVVGKQVRLIELERVVIIAKRQTPAATVVAQRRAQEAALLAQRSVRAERG